MAEAWFASAGKFSAKGVRASAKRCELLLDEHEWFDVEATDEKGRTAFHYAIENGLLDVLALLLRRSGPGLFGSAPKDYLWLACQLGRAGIARLLIACGASVNSVNQSLGWPFPTPLHVAARNGHETVIRLLLGCGADRSLRTPENLTAEELADQQFGLKQKPAAAKIAAAFLEVKAGPADSKQSFLFEGRDWFALCRTDLREAERCVKECKADANLVGPDGFTALGLAVCRGDLELVDMLLRCGADPHKHSTDATARPLWIASLFGFEPVVRRLVDAGAKINEESGFLPEYPTPLHIAAAQGHADTVATLLRAGASPGSRRHDGQTARMLASAQKHDKVEAVFKEAAENAGKPTSPGRCLLV